MPQNFLDCDREQAFLMPPSLRDWLPEDHLAWFVLDTVSRLDLAAFYASYRPDGHRPGGVRAVGDGGAASVFVLDEGVLVAGYRVSLPSGHCVSGDHRQSGSRSLNCCPVRDSS
jgi:hypothetical protein